MHKINAVLHGCNAHYSLFHFNRVLPELERKISVRSSREELIKKGLIKDVPEETIVEEKTPVDIEPSQENTVADTGVDHTDETVTDTSKCLRLSFLQ